MKTRNSDDLDIRAELDLQISFEFYVLLGVNRNKNGRK